MVEIKFFGRGGQGAVIASQILAKAYFLMGWYPQCFSLFGGERRGAPVFSFLRVDEKKILLKCEIKRPDRMIFLASDLLEEKEIEACLKPNGLILINQAQPNQPAITFQTFLSGPGGCPAHCRRAGAGKHYQYGHPGRLLPGRRVRPARLPGRGDSGYGAGQGGGQCGRGPKGL